MTSATALGEFIEKLAAFEAGSFPVLSLYLNLQANQHGRDHYEAFLKKEYRERIKTFPARSAERESLEQDIERVTRYLAYEVRPSANGAALFASHGAGNFFEAIQFEAPIDEHRLYISPVPQIYPLARLDDQFPRYAALLADTNAARLFVFATGRLAREVTLQGVKTKRTSVGGWSQARYQRHTENYHLHHAKDVVEALDRIVRTENIPHVIIAGDEVVVPLLEAQLPPSLREKVVDIMRLEISMPDHDVLRATLEALRSQDARNDVERVRRLYDAHRSGGLAVVTPAAVQTALSNGQVEELVISARIDAAGAQAAAAQPGGSDGAERLTETVAAALVTRAKQTGARVSFVENRDLLEEAGGVGAFLRFKV